MNLITFDNIIKDPIAYVSDIHLHEFQDVADGENVFKNIQPRDNNDEFAKYICDLFVGHKINLNFIRKSPLNQKEPNFIHTDEMMGDITCILYLNHFEPDGNGTTIYDEDNNKLLTMYSKFNRMIAFDSKSPHSRNIYDNFGEGEHARLVQIIFLKQK
jgi:hypothetical protein